MEFFGLTMYGLSDPIKDMMRSDYQEPEKPANLIDVAEKQSDGLKKKSFVESVKELDCYIGYADGYAYKSYDRLHHMRKKYVFKPVGPGDMYKYAGTNSMNYGWWMQDPYLVPLLKGNWYKPRNIHPVYTSEMSKYLNYCLKLDKFFRI